MCRVIAVTDLLDVVADPQALIDLLDYPDPDSADLLEENGGEE